MEISNKKQKFIKRNAATMSPEQMKEAVGLPLREVRKIYREMGIAYEAGEDESAGFEGAGRLFLAGVFILFILIGPFFIRLRMYDFANLPQNAFVQCGALLLAALWMADCIYRRKLVVAGGPFLLPLALFLVWCSISLFWAENKYEGVVALLGWMASFGVLLMTPNLLSDARQMKAVLFTMFLVGFLIAFSGDLQHWGLHKYVPFLADIPQVSPPSSFFANKNMAVPLVNMTAAVGFAFFLKRRDLWSTILLGAALALMAVYLVYTRTRAGWLGFGLMCMFFPAAFFLSRGGDNLGVSFPRKKMVVSAVLLVCAVVLTNVSEKGWEYNLGNMLHRITYTAQEASRHILPGQGEEEKAAAAAPLPGNVASELAGLDLPKPVDMTPPGSQYDESQELRWAIWENTLVMVKEHLLLGVGLGNHKLVYPLYARRAVIEKKFSELSQLMNVHNDYLQALVEVGIIGFAFLVWFFVVMVRTFVFLLKKAEPDKKLFTIAMMTGALGLFVDAFFSFPFQRAIPPVFFATYLGIMSAYRNELKGSKAFSANWKAAPALALILVAGFVYAVRLNARWMKADEYYLAVTSLEKAENWSGVKYYANLAIQENPNRAKVLSYMGRAYIETGDFKDGAASLEKVVAAYPHHMNALLNLGVAYGSLEEYEKALDAYKKVLRIKPDYAKAHNNLANIQMRMGKNQEAFRSFYLASLYDPQNPVIRFNLGIMALALAKYNTAAWAFEEALRLRPDWPPAEKNLGIVLFQNLGRKEEGLAHLQKAISLDPSLAGPGLGEPKEGVVTRYPGTIGPQGAFPGLRP
ncbi:MAG: O-antigen ligase family protein [Thermodesulfobacteriota bacterium]